MLYVFAKVFARAFYVGADFHVRPLEISHILEPRVGMEADPYGWMICDKELQVYARRFHYSALYGGEDILEAVDDGRRRD
jgi:hypothetical protein